MIVSLFIATSCNKTKTCECTATTKYEGELAGMMDDMVATTTTTIDKGKCSDGNGQASSSIMGNSVTVTTKCVEK